MNKGLFDLVNFESKNDDDIINMNINESEEFAHKNPDTNHPSDHFETGGASGHDKVMPSVPGGDSETPKAKPHDAASVTIPEGDNETPKAKPYDAAAIPVPNKVTLTSDQYNDALAALKKSFKEGYELMEMLEQVQIVDESVEDKQDAYIESVIDDQLLAAYEDGPVFEAVKREDKSDVKDVVRSLRGKIEDDLKDQKVKFYKPNLIARVLSGVVPGIGAINLSAAIKQIWSTRLWQVLGVCLVEEGNIKDIADSLTKKYESELNGYKVLYTKAYPSVADVFRVKFNWKNTKDCYFLLVDKKIPKDLAEMEDMVEEGLSKKEEK